MSFCIILQEPSTGVCSTTFWGPPGGPLVTAVWAAAAPGGVAHCSACRSAAGVVVALQHSTSYVFRDVRLVVMVHACCYPNPFCVVSRSFKMSCRSTVCNRLSQNLARALPHAWGRFAPRYAGRCGGVTHDRPPPLQHRQKLELVSSGRLKTDERSR